MKLAIMCEDAGDARALFGLLLHGDSPFDVVALATEDDPEKPFFAEVTLTVDAEASWLLQRAGLEWYANKRAELHTTVGGHE